MNTQHDRDYLILALWRARVWLNELRRDRLAARIKRRLWEIEPPNTSYRRVS